MAKWSETMLPKHGDLVTVATHGRTFTERVEVFRRGRRRHIKSNWTHVPIAHETRGITWVPGDADQAECDALLAAFAL